MTVRLADGGWRPGVSGVRGVSVCVQEYLKNYYADKGQKSSASLSSSPPGRGQSHTILKKSLDHTLSGGEGGGEASEAAPGHSPTLTNRHATFRDVVEIVEFDQVKTGVHFAHEEQLHDDDDYYDEEDFDEEEDELTRGSAATPSECSSVSDDPVLFFSNDDDDSQADRASTATAESLAVQLTDSVLSEVSEVPDSASSPLLGDDGPDCSRENVLQNIFTSLSCRCEPSSADGLDRQKPSVGGVKHVRLRDRMEPVQRQDDYS